MSQEVEIHTSPSVGTSENTWPCCLMYIRYSTDPSGAPTRLMLAMTWLEREKMAGLSPGVVLKSENGMEASLQVKTEMVVYSVGVHMKTDSSYTPTISPEKTWIDRLGELVMTGESLYLTGCQLNVGELPQQALVQLRQDGLSFNETFCKRISLS